MRPLSQSKIDVIFHHLDHGLSICSIARECNVSVSTVSCIRKRHCPDLQVNLGGRPCLLSEHGTRHVIRIISSGKANTAAEVAQNVRDMKNRSISIDTVQRTLKKIGLKAVVKKKKPKLTAKQKKDRLDFAMAHRYWTTDDWKRVVWSDETKINRLQSDGRSWTWKRRGQVLLEREVEETLKFGGGHIMIRGCMLWEGTGNMCEIDGFMDQHLYTEILEDDLLQTLVEYEHTSKKARQFLGDHSLAVLPWPANSPDLNPIEHLWNYIKKRLNDYPQPPNGILELWDRVQDEWAKIPAEECQNPIESLPERIYAVINAKGGHVKY
ncbi:hypothetical protein K3495_g11984 [Podosphaera aphanis]|nr:hypothetical protein K3495_g11984 [Podosphaera aphanis]